METNTNITMKTSLKDVEKHIIQYIVGSIFSGIVALIVFYFSTKYTIENLTVITKSHSQDIREISDSVNKINLNVAKISTKAEVNEKEPENLKEQIRSMEERMLRMEEKQDNIYNILINMNSTLSKRK